MKYEVFLCSHIVEADSPAKAGFRVMRDLRDGFGMIDEIKEKK